MEELQENLEKESSQGMEISTVRNQMLYQINQDVGADAFEP